MKVDITKYLRVRQREWTHNSMVPMRPHLEIRSSTGFVVIDMKHARELVDVVHDICDAHDAEQKERTAP